MNKKQIIQLKGKIKALTLEKNKIELELEEILWVLERTQRELKSDEKSYYEMCDEKDNEIDELSEKLEYTRFLLLINNLCWFIVITAGVCILIIKT